MGWRRGKSIYAEVVNKNVTRAKLQDPRAHAPRRRYGHGDRIDVVGASVVFFVFAMLFFLIFFVNRNTTASESQDFPPRERRLRPTGLRTYVLTYVNRENDGFGPLGYVRTCVRT